MLVRAISALFGVAGLYAAWYFFAVPGIVAVCSFVSFLGCYELSQMIEKQNTFARFFFIVLSYAFFLTFTFLSQSFLTFLSLFVILAAYFIIFTKQDIHLRISKLSLWMMGVLYCAGFTGVVTSGVNQFGGNFFTALLLLSFMTDTFAYLGGRLFGKTPLAPQISPKKTIEGSVCGLIGGSLLGYIFLTSTNHNSPEWLLVLVCLSASLFSQVGDLFESALKRSSGVKDSGRILPGHGGVLDRIDGLLFAAPVVFIWMKSFL